MELLAEHSERRTADGTVSRLKQVWAQEYRNWCEDRLDKDRWVYVYPETHQQRGWMHKTMNVLNCLPKSAQANAKQALQNIWQAETQADAEKAFDLFIKTYEQ